MSNNTGNSEKKKRFLTFFIKILIFLALIGLSAAVIMPVQRALNAGMRNIRDNLIAKAENLTGFQIKYSSIRPTIFGSFDIRNLKLLKNETTFISIARVRVSFSIAELIRRKTTAIHSVQFDRVSLYLDLEKDKDILERLASLSSSDIDYKEVLRKLGELFPEQPVFRIRNSFASVSGEEKQYLINNIDIDITGEEEKLFLAGKLGARLINAKVINKIYNINTEIAVNGECSVDLENAEAQISFSPVAFSEQESGGGKNAFFKSLSNKKDSRAVFDIILDTFNFTYNDGIISLNTLDEGANSGAFLNFNTRASVFFAAVNCADFPLNEIIKFSSGGNGLKRLHSLRVTGSSSFQYEKNGSMQYIVNFEGASSERTDFSPRDDFEIRAHGSEKQIVIDNVRFNLDSQTGELSVFSGSVRGDRFFSACAAGFVVIRKIQPWYREQRRRCFFRGHAS